MGGIGVVIKWANQELRHGHRAWALSLDENVPIIESNYRLDMGKRVPGKRVERKRADQNIHRMYIRPRHV